MASPAVVRLEVSDAGERKGVRATEAADELYRELVKYLPPDAFPDAEASRDKGDPVTLLAFGIALASSGTLMEMVRCVRDWLKRRPERRSLVIRDADGEQIIAVDAEDIDGKDVVKAIQVAQGLLQN
jgi:hypothetical protein